LPAGARGVVISAVEPASDAAEKGIRPGFLIMSVNQQPVTSPAEVAATIEAARRANRRSVLLLVKSGATPEAFVGIDIGAR
ncbi:MAG: PDZ domain-containing protein, partial [Sphingomicrobium sp.]